MTVSDALSKMKQRETVYCVLCKDSRYGIYKCYIDSVCGLSANDIVFEVSSINDIFVKDTILPHEIFCDEESAIPLLKDKKLSLKMFLESKNIKLT